MTHVMGTRRPARTVEGVITDRDISPASGIGPSMSVAVAVCALLVAVVLTGAALAAPGSGLGVRTEGVATDVGAPTGVETATGVGGATDAKAPTGVGAAPGGPARAIIPAGFGVEFGVGFRPPRASASGTPARTGLPPAATAVPPPCRSR
ncbi:hypothetical protein GCM10009680_51530 [Streptomyces yatensis]|uniref:Uncharacterized protein n=1 Tax=Streptomyces yatensis TaxID=155177 RepID=A0ABN2IG65_9ACTN